MPNRPGSTPGAASNRSADVGVDGIIVGRLDAVDFERGVENERPVPGNPIVLRLPARLIFVVNPRPPTLTDVMPRFPKFNRTPGITLTLRRSRHAISDLPFRYCR